MSNDNPAASGPAAPPSTRDQHEEKIKVLSNFVTAVNAGQYHGRDAIHIAARWPLGRVSRVDVLEDDPNDVRPSAVELQARQALALADMGMTRAP